MGGNRGTGVAERLECRHLLALRSHQARDDDIEQEGRNREENGRQHGAQHPLLLDLVVEHGVRGLVGAAVGFARAVDGQGTLQCIDHGALSSTGRELDGDAVEGAGHVVGRRQRLGVDPEHAEAAQVGHAEQAREDVVGRQRHAGHAQRALAAIDQRGEVVVQPEAARLGKRLRHPHRQAAVGQRRTGCAAGLGEPAPQGHEIHARRLPPVQSDQATDDRIAHALQRDAHVGLDVRLHVGHARQRAQPLLEGSRRALDRGEHVGKASARVKVVARRGQRVDRRQRGQQAANTAGHHQRDGERLAPQAAQVAQQLAVERPHAVLLTTSVPPA